LGSSLPPAELARRDSALFGEVKCLFSTALEVGKETEANGGHCGDRTLHRTRSRFDQRVRSVHSVSTPRVSDRTLVWPDQRVRSVHLCTEAERATGASGPSRVGTSGQASRGAESAGVMIGRGAHPVMYDRTRPVVQGAYWTQTGRWLCRVRSYGRAHPVSDLEFSRCVTGASGQFDQRVRSVFRKLVVA
jgi:hypothetical protein